MKSMLFIICLVTTLLASTFAGAADKVVVVPLNSAKAFVNPNDIASFYRSLSATQTVTVLTVPLDRKFMLTDIVGNGNVVIMENNTTVANAFLHDLVATSNTRTEQSINFSTGIPFNSGSALKLGEFDNQTAQITISGYYFQ